MAKGEPKTLSKSAEKRAIFLREYLIERNGTRAAIAAGFSAKSAAVTASKLLKNQQNSQDSKRHPVTAWTSPWTP
jgi:phage terminase small subunit